MKNLIASVLFVLVSVFGFSQESYNDSTISYIKISTNEVLSNKKKIKHYCIYVFDLDNNWIYFTKKNPKYSLTITDIKIIDDTYHIVSKENTKKGSIVSFVVPINGNSEFFIYKNGNKFITNNYEFKKVYIAGLIK